MYLFGTETRLETLKKNEERLNYETVRKTSHCLKSTLGLMGLVA